MREHQKTEVHFLLQSKERCCLMRDHQQIEEFFFRLKSYCLMGEHQRVDE